MEKEEEDRLDRSKSERKGGGTHGTHGTHFGPKVPMGTGGVLAPIERSVLKIRNPNPDVMKVIDYFRIEYGLSAKDVITMMAVHFLKTSKMVSNEITIRLEERKPISTIDNTPKVPSLELEDRLRAIDKILDEGKLYKIVGDEPVEITLGYRQLLKMHTELRRKLMDRTLPSEQRMAVAGMLEKLTDVFNNRVEYDHDYAERMSKRKAKAFKRKYGQSYNETLRETVIPELEKRVNRNERQGKEKTDGSA